MGIPLGSASINAARSILGTPLQVHSTAPLTGFFRDGYCRASPMDPGRHTAAAIVTEEFLDFSASRGNDLRQVGLKQDCKWCLCVSRWVEALTAHKEGRIGANAVPKLVLNSSDESMVRDSGLSLQELEQWAIDSRHSN